MSISSEITSIGENLKKDYQSIANLGADLTNVDKNIENIAELLDGVYDRLPKTEYTEGTEVNLGVTLKGKLDFDDGKVGFGQASQESTNGTNLANTTGYIAPTTTNGITYSLENNIISLNGTSTASFYINLPGKFDLASGNYTFAPADTSGTYTGVCGKYPCVNGTDIFDGNQLSTLANRTLNSDYTNVFIRLFVSNGSSYSNYKCKLNLVKGTYTSQTIPAWGPYTGGQASPNPSYPQQIKSVTGNQDVVVSGKNKCNVGEMQLGTISQTDGTTISSSGDVKYSGYISVKPSTIYALSYTNGNPTIRIFKYNGNKTYLGTSVISGMTYTTDSDTHYIRVQGNVSFIDNNFQIEENSTATTYEPYITPTSYQLSLGDIELFEIIRNSSSILRDKIIKMNGKFYKEKNVGKVEVDSTLNPSISLASTNTARVVFSNLLANNPPMTISGVIGYSNYFKQNANWGTDAEGFFYDAGNYALWFRGNKSTIGATEEAILSWIHANKPYFIYPLATPVLEEITDETLISQLNAWYNAQSINGTTIITSNGNLPMIIKVRGLKGE